MKSYSEAVTKEKQVRTDTLAKVIDVESQDLTDEEIDLTLREERLRIGIVPTDSVVALDRHRRGQERLRLQTLSNYDSMCAVCDVNEAALLITSHIVGWQNLVRIAASCLTSYVFVGFTMSSLSRAIGRLLTISTY